MNTGSKNGVNEKNKYRYASYFAIRTVKELYKETVIAWILVKSSDNWNTCRFDKLLQSINIKILQWMPEVTVSAQMNFTQQGN